ncbi:MAG: Ig-like domain-containing protein [bacterium]|nr:Ig-like domain-containing protein [bacterium]
MVRIKGYSLLIGLACLLAFSACGGNGNGGGGTTTTRVTITLTADPASIPADGTTTSSIVAKLVNSRDATPVADGTAVTFSLETSVGGMVYPLSTTTTSGIAKTTLTAGSAVGSVTVKAVNETFSKTATVEFTEPTINNQSYSISPSADPNPIQIYGTSLISAEIRDIDGNLAADGVEVTFSSAITGVSFNNPAYTVGGVATATLTADSTPGWSAITIKAGNESDDTLNIQILDLTIPNLTLSETKIASGKSTTVTAEVRDTQGNLAMDQSPVIFTTNLLGATFTPTTSVTTGGLAQVEFKAGVGSGPATITAKVGKNHSASVDLTVGVSNVTMTATATPPSVNINETSNIKVEVRSEGTLAPDGTPVTYSTDFTGAVITSQAETTSGIASATFTAGEIAGRATIKISCGNGANAKTITLGINVVGQVASIAVSATPNPISVNASSSVRAELRDALGHPVPNGTPVKFSTSMSWATITESSDTSSGQALATFTAGQSYGNASVTVTSGTVTNNSLTIEILPPVVGSIEFVSASPLQVGVKGSGQAEVSTVIFKVRDKDGNAAPDGTLVDFDLFGPKGGEYISPVTNVTINGQATTYLQAGKVAGPVRIEASTLSDNGTPANLVDDITLTSASIGISIGAGLPSMRNFSLSIANGGLNVAGLDCYGIPAPINAYLADRYYNFAVEGTSVNFFTEGGAISPTVWTDNKGGAIATMITQGPAPLDMAPGAQYQCGQVNTCLNPCVPERSSTDVFYGPHHTYNPRDGVNTILATTIGEETFDDKNGNGIYNLGESFEDISEPFLDADDDGVYDYAEPFTDGVDVNGVAWASKVNNKYDPPTPWIDNNLVDDDLDGNAADCDAPTDCNNKWDKGEICQGELENPSLSVDCTDTKNSSGCVCFPGEKFWDKWIPGLKQGDGMWNEAEFYVDYNKNGKFDRPNGVWDAQTMIWTKIRNIFTDSNFIYQIHKVDGFGCDDPPATIAISLASTPPTNNFVFDLSDYNYNPLDNINVGFAVASGSSAFCKVLPVGYVNVDPSGVPWTHFEFSVIGTAAGSCEVDITATWNNTCIGTVTLKPFVAGTVTP